MYTWKPTVSIPGGPRCYDFNLANLNYGTNKFSTFCFQQTFVLFADLFCILFDIVCVCVALCL